jgi:hypothetical protein
VPDGSAVAAVGSAGGCELKVKLVQREPRATQTIVPSSPSAWWTVVEGEEPAAAKIVRCWVVAAFEGAAARDVAERAGSGDCSLLAGSDDDRVKGVLSAPRRDETGRRGGGDCSDAAERLGAFPARSGEGAPRAREARVGSEEDAAAAEEVY